MRYPLRFLDLSGHALYPRCCGILSEPHFLSSLPAMADVSAKTAEDPAPSPDIAVASPDASGTANVQPAPAGQTEVAADSIGTTSAAEASAAPIIANTDALLTNSAFDPTISATPTSESAPVVPISVTTTSQADSITANNTQAVAPATATTTQPMPTAAVTTKMAYVAPKMIVTPIENSASEEEDTPPKAGFSHAASQTTISSAPTLRVDGETGTVIDDPVVTESVTVIKR